MFHFSTAISVLFLHHVDLSEVGAQRSLAASSMCGDLFWTTWGFIVSSRNTSTGTLKPATLRSTAQPTATTVHFTFLSGVIKSI